MSFTAVEDTPIEVYLPDVAQTTGWTVDGDIATHESCNAGNIELTGYTIVDEQTYEISYQVISVSGGYVQVFLGTTAGAQRTTAGNYIETLTAAGTDPLLYFYSNANCSIKAFNIRNTVEDTTNGQKYTIAYSPVLNKWTSFYSVTPDYGFSMFTRTLLFKFGLLYSQLNGSSNRNNLFGTHYQTILTLVDNENTEIVKSYLSLSIQSNVLLVTGDDGITTSLGQISELSEIDFVKGVLSDGVSSAVIDTIEGVYSANFLRDKNDDLQNGTPLKGNYMLLTLIDNSTEPLLLYTVNILSKHSAIGSR